MNHSNYKMSTNEYLHLTKHNKLVLLPMIIIIVVCFSKYSANFKYDYLKFKYSFILEKINSVTVRNYY